MLITSRSRGLRERRTAVMLSRNPTPIAASVRTPAANGRSSSFIAMWLPSGLAVCLFCALFVFAWLAGRDAKLLNRVSAVSEWMPQPAAAVKAEEPAREQASQVPETAPPRPKQLSFQLVRGHDFDRVGPVMLRLLRTDVRSRTCRIAHRKDRRHSASLQLRINRPTQVDGIDGPVQIVVTGITRQRISGLVEP